MFRGPMLSGQTMENVELWSWFVYWFPFESHAFHSTNNERVCMEWETGARIQLGGCVTNVDRASRWILRAIFHIRYNQTAPDRTINFQMGRVATEGGKRKRTASWSRTPGVKAVRVLSSLFFFLRKYDLLMEFPVMADRYTQTRAPLKG